MLASAATRLAYAETRSSTKQGRILRSAAGSPTFWLVAASLVARGLWFAGVDSAFTVPVTYLEDLWVLGLVLRRASRQ
jgi:hypothetical protein